MIIPSEQRVSLLRALPSFDTLPPEELERISSVMAVETFEAGQKIVCERELGDRMYLIVSGTVSVAVEGAAGAVDLGYLTAGEIFGEIALLTEMRRRRATIAAKTPTVALTLTRPDFEEIVDVYPDIREELTVASDELMNKRLKALMAAKAQLDQQP